MFEAGYVPPATSYLPATGFVTWARVYFPGMGEWGTPTQVACHPPKFENFKPVAADINEFYINMALELIFHVHTCCGYWLPHPD